MPGRRSHSGRVVIMDDIAWSEPAPRGRRLTAELDPPAWIHSHEPDTGEFERDRDHRDRDLRDRDASPGSARRHDGRRYEGRDTRARPRSVGSLRAEDYLEQRDYAAELSNGWDTIPAAEPVVIEYTDSVDEEEIWGPRPKLLAGEAGGRRTVVITGRGGDRAVVPAGRPRQSLQVRARNGFQADHTAMWAVLLCVIVLLAAVATH